VKFGTLMAAVLVLATIMISTTDLGQNLAIAQNTTSITPASGSAGSNDDETSSSEDNESDNKSTDSSSEEDTDSQDMTSSEEDVEETEEDSEQTNPLLEEIRNRVSGALSATGMSGPGF
jgi:cytoskeletal protein RodZ